MGSYDDYYMNPKFDPQKVTIAQLREILDAHNVLYTGGEKKADLIRIFNKHVRPLIPSLLEKKTRASKIKNDSLRSHSIHLLTRRWSIIHVVIFAMLFSFGFAIIYNDEFSNVSTSYERVQKTNWIPCPSNAHCSNDKIISCDKGFVLVSSSIPWLKSFTSRCILDHSLARRVKKYTELLKNIAAKEAGRIECETGHRKNLSFQKLLIQLRNRKFDTDQDFELLTRIVLEHLKSDNDVEVIYKKEAYLTYKVNFKIQEITKEIIGSVFTLILIAYFVGKLIYSQKTSETDSEIKETDSEIKETEMTVLSIYNLEYLSVKEYFHQGLPNRTILGILKLKMPAELVKAHETYKSQNFLNRTHRMFHGTKSLCDPQRFIENPQAKFCKKGCGVCGIAQEGNRIIYSKYYNHRKMWFANSSSTSFSYCNKCSYLFNSNANAMFVVDVASVFGGSIITVDRDV
ncbi:28080_t:CDS:2, partial [Racocetra persica]